MIESTYHPVCCGRPMQYKRGHHDYTRQAYRCPACGKTRVEVSTDRGLHWTEEKPAASTAVDAT